MADNDDTVGEILFAIEMLFRVLDWPVEPGGDTPADIEAAEFLESCRDDMSVSWPDFIATVLSMLPYGWAAHEIVYKIRDGEQSRFDDQRVGWRKFAYQPQEALNEWVLDDHGGVQEFRWTAHGGRGSIPIEKLLLFRTTTARGPSGRSVLRNAYRCFSADTELLTGSGWKPIGDVTTADTVATLNDNTLEFQHPTDVWSYDYDGQLLHIHSRFLDQLVTPNHRLYVRRDHRDDWEWIEADAAPKSARHKAHADWHADDTGPFTVPGATQQNGIIQPHVIVDADAWAEFLGWYLAEGNAYRRIRGTCQAEVGLVQNEGPKADRIRDCLNRLPWNVYERVDNRGRVRWTISNLSLYEHLAPLGKATEKRVPRYVMDWSARQINLFLDAYWLGDGTTKGATQINDTTYTGTDVIATASPGMADDLMELALRAGHRPQLTWQPGTHSYGDGVYQVTLGKPFDMMAKSHDWVDYEGQVHCVTVPNGTVYVRRNGKAQWSGNSWWFKKRLEDYAAIAAEKDATGTLAAWIPADSIIAQDDMYKAAQDVVTRFHRDEQAGMVWPLEYDELGNQMFDLTILDSNSARSIDAIRGLVNMHAEGIAGVVLADFIRLGRTQSGARALAEPKQELFQKALQGWVTAVAEVLNRFAIPRLFELNSFNVETLPRFNPEEIADVDLADLGDFIKSTAQAGADWGFLNAEDPIMNQIRQKAGFDAAPAVESISEPEGREPAMENEE